MTERRNQRPALFEGGWSGDGSFRVTVTDPHNHRTMIELRIPERTFVNMLRNYGGYNPPLGEMEMHPKAIRDYGKQVQRGQVLIPLTDISASTFREVLPLCIPDGWTASEQDTRRWNMHRADRDEGVYRLAISRMAAADQEPTADVPDTAPDGTTIEFPWEPVYYELSEYGQEES